MNIIFEIVKTFAQIFSEMLTAIGTAIWENLPEILQFKQIMGYFTPAGIVALFGCADDCNYRNYIFCKGCD